MIDKEVRTVVEKSIMTTIMTKTKMKADYTSLAPERSYWI